jgi:hypothetical protein
MALRKVSTLLWSDVGEMTDPDERPHIWFSDQLAAYRAQLITDVFGGTLPAEVGTLESVASPIGGLTNLDRCEKIVMTGYAARPRVWWPAANANNQVMIVHQGHTGGYTSYNIDLAIQQYLTAGFTVCGCVMPGGANETTSSTSTDHQNNEPSIADLVGPTIVAVNTLVGGHNAVHMQGLSGGGWTTTLAAALDVRITNSYPTAGSLPLYTTVTHPENGFRDWEQLLPGLTQARYLDLYIMGSCGSGRRQKQILHINDNVGFSFEDFSTGYDYSGIIAANAARLGGDYDLFWADKDTHVFHTDIIAAEILTEVPV